MSTRAHRHAPEIETERPNPKALTRVYPYGNARFCVSDHPGGGLVVIPDAWTLKDDGLLSYGVDQVDPFRRAAAYVDRILRGTKPAELPVQLPTKFEMVVNRKTAMALGLAVPPSIVPRADEVIE